jgi:Fe(3+) dicitrate transport protein
MIRFRTVLRRHLPFAFCWLFVGLAVASVEAQTAPATGTLAGRVLDPSGAVVPQAVVVVKSASGEVASATTDESGQFTLPALAAGKAEITVDGQGFRPSIVEASIVAGGQTRVEVGLEIGGLTESVRVVPERVIAGDDAARRIPGSVEILDLAILENGRVLTTGEALRKASGVHVREEEGFSLRPNIGVRGLNPTRSSRVLLLEDGIPLTYAPYGDNASYYHPPIERFERIELLKGSGQIAYGPMTVGGVINYVTPAPPGRSAGSFLTSAGNRGLLNVQGGWGTTIGSTGVLVDFMHKQGDGPREHISTDVNDVNAKVVSRLNDRHVLTFRGSYYAEDSNVTYSGLREDEYRQDRRQNSFKSDYFYGDRYGASATHAFTLAGNVVATTNVYLANFRRHWWRQSSNSSQRPNDAADPACGGMANLNTTCGNEGRLRQYVVWGVEPRLRASNRFGQVRTETELGVRAHFEDQQRRQENGDTPTARSGRIVEDNERLNQAYSGFAQSRVILGDWSVTPGIRVERVNYERTNRLASVTGETNLTEVIPGIGTSYSPGAALTVFAGVHRGFSPPRTEDVINNTTGGVVDLDPERSWNYELGVRGRVGAALSLDAAFFRMDYENQVIPATLAGGVGSTLTNAGATLHQGLEATARFDSAPLLRTSHNVYARTAFTWLPLARFEGVRYSSVPGFGTTSIAGNRLPYAPEHLLTAGVGYTHASGFDVNAEAVLVGDQFGDDLNTIAGSADGQRGLLPAYTLWNAAANYPVARSATVFVAVKNLLDSTVIVDRSRGILPSMPRLFQAGLRVRF